MNRRELQTLANLRAREARALFRVREYSGSYYLGGYAVECALKDCIAKKVRRHDFPERQQQGKDPYIHNLAQLAALAGLEDDILRNRRQDALFHANWEITVLWSEQSRYRIIDPAESKRLLDAIMKRQHGIMPWLKRHW